MMMNWHAYIIVFFTAATKFLAAPFVGINGFGLSFFHTFLTVAAGGIFGTIVFFTIGSKLIQLNQKIRRTKFEKLKSLGKPLPKLMTRMNKLIVKTKHIFGVVGITFLTASILSIPIGSIICVKFYRHKKSTIFIVFLFVIINSLLLSLLAGSFPSLGK